MAGFDVMTLTEFLTRVIDDGIIAAKQSYREGDIKRDGAVAGFEACRACRSVSDLTALLVSSEREKIEAGKRSDDRYWWYVTFHAEIEWTSNCVSALLQNQGMPVIVAPTARGYIRAASIVGVAGSVTA